MSVEKNKAAVRTVVEEIWNKGNLDVIDKHISHNFIYQGLLGEYRGTDGFRQMVKDARAIFPDIHYTIDEMFGEGDKLAVQYTMTGTMKGAMMSIPPTGKQIKATVAFFYRFEDGKEAEALPFSDSLTMFQQLGIPFPGNK